jgi:hypothetical protein
MELAVYLQRLVEERNIFTFCGEAETIRELSGGEAE